jgi:hypothetical protein
LPDKDKLIDANGGSELPPPPPPQEIKKMVIKHEKIFDTFSRIKVIKKDIYKQLAYVIFKIKSNFYINL